MVSSKVRAPSQHLLKSNLYSAAVPAGSEGGFPELRLDYVGPVVLAILRHHRELNMRQIDYAPPSTPLSFQFDEAVILSGTVPNIQMKAEIVG
jgi:hypothetical protein